MPQDVEERRIYEQVASLVSAGKLEVNIDKSFPLAAASQARAYSMDGHAEGKVVLVSGHSAGRAKVKGERTLRLIFAWGGNSCRRPEAVIPRAADGFRARGHALRRRLPPHRRDRLLPRLA